VVYLFLVYLDKVIKFPLWGIEQWLATLVVTLLFIIIAFYPLMLKYRFIYFSDDGNTIIFRYYAVGLFKGPKRSVEIPKKNFSGYQINKQFPGLIRSITLYQQMGKGKAEYPPIHISSLTKKELNKIITTLRKYSG
jgi:hypothetical protein